MRVLLDSCVHRAARTALEAAGHDVAAVADQLQDPGGAEILRQAVDDVRVVVTLDKDFGELAVLGRQRHSGIVRLVDIRAAEQGIRCVEALSLYGDDLAQGAIVTVERGSTRVRPPE